MNVAEPKPLKHRYKLKLWGCSSVGERLLCKQEVTGSNPVSSTKTSAWDYLGLRCVDDVGAISVIVASKHQVRYKTGTNDCNTVEVASGTRYTAEMLVAASMSLHPSTVRNCNRPPCTKSDTRQLSAMRSTTFRL